MVNIITIKCPLCKEKATFFLTIKPTIIIFRCPECWTLLKFDGGKITQFSEDEFKKAQSDVFEPSEKSDNLNFPMPGPTWDLDGASSTTKNLPKPGTTNIDNGKRKVDTDYIIDLYKLLETIDDAEKFIEKI